MSGREYSPQEAELIAEFIAANPPGGNLPLEVFVESGFYLPKATVELVVFKGENVVLTKRSGYDPVPEWCNQWHVPGKNVMPEDLEGIEDLEEGYENALGLLLIKEFNSPPITKPERVTIDPPKPRFGPRGWELPILYHAKLSGRKPRAGKLFPMGRLPKDLIPGHQDIILRAAFDLISKI